MTDPALLPLVVAALGGALLGAAPLLLDRHRWRAGRRAAERAEEAATARLRLLTEHLREAVITYDRDRRPTFVNRAFERLTGYGLADLADLEFLEYIHPDDRQLLLAEWERLDRGETIDGQEYRILTRDRAIQWSAGSWRPLRDAAGRAIGYLGTELDITERKRTEHDLRLDVELFQAVMEVQQAVVAAGLDPTVVMRVIAERAHALTHADGVLIEVLEGDELVSRVDTGVPAGAGPRVETSLSGVCVRTGEVQRCEDTASDRRVDPEVTRRQGIRSLVAVPLKAADGRVLGVLKVVWARPGAFSEREVRALRLMAGLVGAALEHAAFFESRQARLEERTQALQESEQRFKQLVDAAQEGIWVLDERQVTTYVNQRMAELLDYPKGEILGRPVYDFMEQSARGPAREALAGPNRPAGRFDLRFRRRDGSELWAMVSASPLVQRDGARVGTVAMVTDVTDRRATEERLRRTAERLAMLHDLDRAVLDARPIAEIGRAALARLGRIVPVQRAELVVFDTAAGEARLLAGFDGPRSLPGAVIPLAAYGSPAAWRRGVVQCIADLAQMDDPPERLRRMLDAGIRAVLSAPLLVEGEAVGQLDLGAAGPDAFTGEHRDLLLEVVAPLALAVQQARLRDELARRRGEHERRLAERAAAVRELGSELDAVVGGLAHEVRSPIRQLHGFASLLLEEAGPAGPARHAAERIRAAADRLGTLVDDLVRLGRLGRQELLREPTDLGVLVGELIGRIEGQEGGRRIDWRVDRLGVVACDRSLAAAALGHLLANAAKFTRPRAEPVIRVERVELEGEAGVVVRDNGVGFDPERADRLFEPFARLHPPEEFPGSGLGLAIVRRVAEKHGGRAWAEAEPDRGAAFYLTFGAGRGG